MSEPVQENWESVAAAVAHEIGTPLTVSRGLLRAAARSDLDAETSELLEAALRHLGVIELQLVRLQRLDTEDWLTPDKTPTDLVALAQELLDDLHATMLSEHTVRLEGLERLLVPLDADQIRQVVFNLLSNAAKYAPARQDIVVEVTEADGSARLWVRDRGHGVAPEDAERIFDKYARATDVRPGAGLGLYLARRIARAHDGELRLMPAEQDGATFELQLPLPTT